MQVADHPDRGTEREIISARLSPRAAQGWRDFCRRNGVSLTAFMEVAGRDLAADESPSLIPDRQRLVDAARSIDIERRDRRPG